MALTNDDIVKTLSNMMTKQEYQAFLRSIETINQLVASGGYYQKPNDGIPKKDLDVSLQQKIDEIDQCYKPGKAINEDSLPSNVPTKTYVDNATRGLIRTDLRANRVIDEVYEARESTTGEPMTSIKDNLNTHYSRKDEIIANVNSAGESGTIAKSHIQPPAHSEVTGTTSENCHPMTSIIGLVAALSEKVNIIEIIAKINLSAEPTKISVAQIDMSGLVHNSLGDRDAVNCHPQSAIIDLEGDIGAIETTLTTLNNIVGDHGGAITTLQGNDNCLAQAIAQLFNLMGQPIPACVQALL